jgi:hypothetical protein
MPEAAGMLDDAVGLPGPGEDLADLRAIPLRASFGGQEDGASRLPTSAAASACPVFSGDAILG